MQDLTLSSWRDRFSVPLHFLGSSSSHFLPPFPGDWYKFAWILYLGGDDPSFCSLSTCGRTSDGSLFLSFSTAYMFLFKWILCAEENMHFKNYQNKSLNSKKLCKPWKSIKMLPSFIQPEIKFTKTFKNWHFHAQIKKSILFVRTQPALLARYVL